MKVVERCLFPGCDQIENGGRHYGYEADHDPIMPEKRKGRGRSDAMADFMRDERIPVIEEVFERDRGMCQIRSEDCRSISDDNPLTCHEKRSRGTWGGIRAPGINTPFNCVAACAACNSYVATHRTWAEEAGWSIPYTAEEVARLQDILAGKAVA